MNLAVTYIDHNHAELEERERFSFTKSRTRELYGELISEDDVKGAVIISTCNRTELYVSMEDGVRKSPFEILCRVAKIAPEKNRHIAEELYGYDAVSHLCLVSAGAESQLWGDGQIITQVNDAIRLSRECSAADPVLNVVFEKCIAAGKKIKTNVSFNLSSDSTAKKAVSKVKEHKSVRKALVIGNGMMGRMIAGDLAASGIETVMTLRQYKYGEIVIPKGVETVMYHDRYEELKSCQAVISATASPHYTLEYDEIVKLKSSPSLFIDMAVPRDVDPRINEIDEKRCLNIDDISAGTREALKEEQRREMEEYISGSLEKIKHWEEFRNNMEKKIYVVGIGPGGSDYMTPQAREAIERSDVVVGYTVYVELVKDLCEGKTVRDTAMKKEVDRCKIALDYALRGKKVAFVCSGDAGV